MASKFVFFLFVACVAYTAGQDNSEGNDSSASSDDNRSGSEDSAKSYPCSLDDFDCIRNYFVNTNLCTSASHKDGDPIVRDFQVSYLPKWNVSLYSYKDTITMYGSSIETLYVNRQTNNLVMTVNFDGINIHTPHAQFHFHIRGDEAMIVEEFVNVTYRAAITAVVPDAGLRGVAGAAVSSYNIDAVPPFEIGPKITASSNAVVNNFFEGLISDIPTAVQELLLTKAPFFFYIYLQEYICNYGIEFSGIM